jgi:hypothetical protein
MRASGLLSCAAGSSNRTAIRESCRKRSAGDSGLMVATWNRRFWEWPILAFAGHSNRIDMGRDDNPPLVTLGWYRWRPDSTEFPRLRKVGR